LLANGKRVLVTSQTTRALEVLRDKVPAAIQALCVMALSNDRDGLKSLQMSVGSITAKQQTWTKSAAVATAADLARQLDEARSNLQQAIIQQRDRRESEVRKHERIAGRYDGTLAEVARAVRAEADEFGQIRDRIELPGTPPISADRFAGALDMLTEAHETPLPDNAPAVPSVADMPSPDEFERYARRVSCLESNIRMESPRQDIGLAHDLVALGNEERDSLRRALDEVDKRLGELRRRHQVP
jgi:hypothetical protein